MIVPLEIFALVEGLGQIIIGGILFIVAFVVIGHILGALGSKAFDKADKKAKKGNGGCITLILIFAVACFVTLCIVMGTEGSSKQNTEIKWSPRHI